MCLNWLSDAILLKLGLFALVRTLLISTADDKITATVVLFVFCTLYVPQWKPVAYMQTETQGSSLSFTYIWQALLASQLVV